MVVQAGFVLVKSHVCIQTPDYPPVQIGLPPISARYGASPEHNDDKRGLPLGLLLGLQPAYLLLLYMDMSDIFAVAVGLTIILFVALEIYTTSRQRAFHSFDVEKLPLDILRKHNGEGLIAPKPTVKCQLRRLHSDSDAQKGSRTDLIDES
ncbi:hypothetical protein G7Y89_g2334 [Cudoniella acicularis]|uniref:Uncharacterized protein n=1 Tax=Cudoniella acicularis TaxID=354080 RepID=A0A8H4RUC0_9HELO|nr:hypothetical protein G7Y89_g2334 [Cudoniella acicularis]